MVAVRSCSGNISGQVRRTCFKHTYALLFCLYLTRLLHCAMEWQSLGLQRQLWLSSIQKWVCQMHTYVQASADLPESGVVTSDTWQALLGKGAKPIDAKKLALNDGTDDDMTANHDGMVYLIGEQRWERKSQPTI